jgi:hypothetical protein
MKARISPGWLFGMAWGAVAAAHVFAQEPPAPPTTTTPDAALAAAMAANKGAPPPRLPLAPLVPASAADLSPAPNTPLSAGSSEIRSLTQAGVEQPVIVAYITNSPRIFNLSPDDIIQLQGAGVPPAVISAMIQHDQALRATASPPTDPAPLTATLAVMPPAPGEVQIIANDESWADDYLAVDDGYSVAEQPENAGPVRMPYPVKLNDPIVILKLPTFTVPCW